MNNREIIAEVERRVDAANRTPQGADDAAILRAVAADAGRPYEEVRALMVDAWSALARTL